MFMSECLLGAKLTGEDILLLEGDTLGGPGALDGVVILYLSQAMVRI